MIKKSINLMLVISIVFLSSGCSTLVYGNRQNITVNSNPQGARVKIGSLKGKTPYNASLATNKDYVVEISKKGYQSEQVQVVQNFRATTTILGNILWLFIGVVIDAVSGAAHGLSPTDIDVDLEKI